MTEITIEVLTKFVGLIAALFTAYKLATKYFGANGRKIKALEERLAEAERNFKQIERKVTDVEKKCDSILSELAKVAETLRKDIKDLENDNKEFFKILVQRK